MDYARIAQKVYGEPWCITPEMHAQIQRILQAHIDGNKTNLNFVAQRNEFNAAALGLTPPRNVRSRVYTRGKLAYVPVSGIIGKSLSSMEQMCGGYSIDQLQSDIADVSEDSSITKALFHFNSPGGQISGIPETASMLAELGKRVETIGAVDNVSGSAAYWLMSQCNYIYATESSETGSIGVYVALLDRTEQLAAQGVKVTVVKAGKHKAAGLPGNPLSEEEIKLLQEKVDGIYQRFTSMISAKRPQVASSTMQGQTFFGKEAQKLKLVDALTNSVGSLVAKLS